MDLLKFKGLVAGLSLLAATQLVAADIHPICSQGDRDIVPIHLQAPYYPHSAWLSCIEGHVVIEFVIDERGRVVDPVVSESEPPALFDRAALTTVRQWTFLPRCIDGQPVSRTGTQRIEFTHEGIKDSACRVELDEQATALLIEITTWYALLHDHLLEHNSLHDADHLIPGTETGFSGDLAKVAEFHRQVIDTAIERSDRRWVSPQPRNLFMDPVNYDDPPAPEKVVERLVAHRNQYEAEALLRARFYREQQEKFRELRANTRLPQEQLELLVYAFLGSFDQDLDGLFPPDAEALSLLSDIAQFLELHLGDWSMEGWAGTPIFEDELLMTAFIERFEALANHVQELKDAHGQWSGSFLDYLH